MSRLGKYRSVQKSSDKNVSIIKANPFFRLLAFFIDAVIIRTSFQLGVILLHEIQLISDEFFTEIMSFLYLGIAPLRGNILIDPIIVNSLTDLKIHLVFSAYFLLYFIILESKLGWSKTIGKKITKMKVVDEKGQQISLRSSFLRNITKYIFRFPWAIIGFIFAVIEFILIFTQSIRTGDILGKTIVASETKKQGELFRSDDEDRGSN